MCHLITQLFTVLGWVCFGLALLYALAEEPGYCLFFCILGTLLWFSTK